MARPIKVSEFLEQARGQFLKQFDEYIGKNQVCDTTLKFSINLDEYFKQGKEAALLIFTPIAFIKMQQLVKTYEKEVGVHGICTKDDTIFTVHDLFFYPQETTGATVQATDDYPVWLHTLPDETFDHTRFQMHSHVNFGATPSGVDTDFYRTLLTNLQDFYVFMIMNKREEIWVNIYDIENNILYENKDVEVLIAWEEDKFVEDWIGDGIKEYVKLPPPVTYPGATVGVGAGIGSAAVSSNVHHMSSVDDIKKNLTGTDENSKESQPKRGRGRPRKNDQGGNPPKSSFREDTYQARTDGRNDGARQQTALDARANCGNFLSIMSCYGCPEFYDCDARIDASLNQYKRGTET